MKEQIDRYYCDDCGEPVWQSASSDHPEIELQPWRAFEKCLYETMSTLAGESAIVCVECHQERVSEVKPAFVCPACGKDSVFMLEAQVYGHKVRGWDDYGQPTDWDGGEETMTTVETPTRYDCGECGHLFDKPVTPEKFKEGLCEK